MSLVKMFVKDGVDWVPATPEMLGGSGGSGGGAAGSSNTTEATQLLVKAAVQNLDADIGAPADAVASSDSGTFSLIALIKRGLGNWTSLLARIPTLSSGRMPVDGSGVTQPVSASALPLPLGASTSAKQDSLLAALLATPSDITLDSAGTAFSPASCSHAYGYDGSGNMTTDTATDGAVVRVKTLTHTAGNMTAETKWVVQ